MPHHTRLAPSWNTTSMGHPANVSRGELSFLKEHFTDCALLRGRLQALQSNAAAMQGLVSTRFMSIALTLVLIGVAVHLAF